MAHRLLALLPALLCVALAGAATVPPGRLFHAAFDGSLAAAQAAGSAAGQAEGKPEFTAGHAGQAVVVGDLGGAAAVTFPSAGNIRLERGTVSLWVMPVNWQGDDKQNHLFLQAPAAAGGYLLYKYATPSWGLNFHVDPNEGVAAKTNVYKPIADWRPGQWHHVACSWTRYEAAKLYVDGRLAAQSQGVGLTQEALGSVIRFGGCWGANGDRTALDEAMVFGRMLSDEEIASLAGVTPSGAPAPLEGPASSRPAVPDAPRDVPGVMLTHALLGQRVLARVYDDALGEPCRQARLSLLGADAKEVVGRNLALQAGLNEAQLDLARLPLGVYEARLTLLREGKPAAVEALRIPKETNETWADAAKLGKRDRVLPPFLPLKTTGGHLECYARSAVLGGDGLPTRMTSRGKELLAGPVRIVAADAVGAAAFTAGKLECVASSDARAGFTGSALAGQLALRTQVEARYDGTLWFSLTLDPRQPLELQKLRVEVPLRSEMARLYAYDAYGRMDDKRFGYGAVPEGAGTVWQREFLPALWLGTEDLGLGWYAESDEHWDVDGEQALSLERDGQTLRLCMNIVRQARRVERPFKIEFGLLATPVRPLQPDWRSYQQLPSSEITRYFLHLRKNPYPRADLAGQTPSGKVAYLYAYHEYFTATPPKDPEEFAEMVWRVQEYGLLGTPYTDTTFLPEWQGDLMLRPEMRVRPSHRATSYGPVCNVDVCHCGPFGDWYVWYIHHLIGKYGINGIYFDDMCPYGCANVAHGCGYVAADGTRRRTYAMRARMETFRRVRELFADTGRPFFITYHISGGRVPPLAIYGDGLLMAEERYPIVGKNPDYTTNTTSAEWRASFSPEAWGIPVYVIPQFKMNPEWMKDPELAERLLAAVVPHDLLIWPLFAHEPTLLAARKIQEEFGIGEADTKLLPFWHEGTGLTCDRAEVLLTGYQRPGKLLLCASNPTDEPLTVSLGVDLAKLGLPAGARGRDLRTGATVAVEAGVVRTTLPAKRVQFIEVK
ncbi:LamG domain-containing protein [bacterium]|nr:LamG domain-containing protein [bacterium]